MMKRTNSFLSRIVNLGLALITTVVILYAIPALGDDFNLMTTYYNLGGSIFNGCAQASDTASAPIVILIDSDTPAGSHTIHYSSGLSRTDASFHISSTGGVASVDGGATIDTLPVGNPNPDSPGNGSVIVYDNIPTSYGIGGDPPPIVSNNTVYLDYNSATNTSFESKPLNITSNFEWNNYRYGPDSVYGYEDVYWGPQRGIKNYSQPIYFYVPGGVVQDPNEKHVYPGCPTSCCGAMAVASLDRFQAGVSISDAPVGYTPPIGRDMHFQVTYHQRLSNQPSTFNFSNLGQKWSFNWLSYISGGPTNGLLSATYFEPGGSQYTYGGYQETTPPSGLGVYAYQGDFTDNQGWNLATLHYRQNPERYERWLPDGTVEVFGQGVGTSPNRLFFLTSITDPQGNVTALTYDPVAANAGNAVLTTVTDPLGKQLVFGYEDTSDPLKITKVTRTTDGLSAKFGYASGELTSSTDTIGITSTFNYTSGTSFISSMTTPYGTTTFSSTDGSGFLEADMTNPLGQNERVEYQESLSTSLVAASDSSAPSATGLTIDNSTLNLHNSFYWSRRAMADAAAGSIATDSAGFYALAQASHWAESSLGSIPVPLSAKKPLEGRVWYNYPGQPDDDHVEVTASGAMVQPSVTARLLDGGATQASFAGYNSNGMITQSIDPVGRTTNYNYATNGIDLLTVKQTSGGGSGGDLLSTMTYNGQHEPLTIIDASDQTTTLTYNTPGQLLTRTVVVGGSNQTTTLAYNANGYLSSVTGPVTGATTSYTYDAAGRVQTVTDSEGYVISTAYDNLDRPTVTTYPDSAHTTDQTVYNKLDVAKTIDRQGRVTTNQYDAIRELLQTTDPLGRATKYTWCTCGGLSTLTDANGNVTTWGLDEQGRVTSKTYADSSAIDYVYQTNTSRLSTMTDARGSVATYAYNVDNTLSGTTYSPGSGVATTPNVSFTYDSVYNRVTAMTDGTGTTSYSYNPINAALGAGRLSSVSVPIAGGTAAVTYAYDELGRVVTRDVDHSTTDANNVGTTFDALGRVTGVSNALGAFTYAYVDETSRLSSVTYPTGTGGTGHSMITNYSYYGNTGDQRLEEIQNLKYTTQLSQFDYTYNAVGTIATWTQQADSSTAVVNTLSYDGADQLVNAVQSGGGSASNAYHYDPAGNRLAEVTGSGTTAGQFNNLNQLTGLSSSTTSTTVAGHTSAAITSATINALPATITSSTNFTANVPLPTGATNVVSVVATPTSSSTPVTTQREQIVTTGTAPTALTYDANGNVLTDENGNGYTWDALNRLTKITYSGGATSNFAYDGLSRRVSIIEKNSGGTVTSTKNYLWIGQEIAEERDASNTVTKRFFPQGEQQSGTNYYYTRDHLGSVREMCSSTGTITSRMAYDMYGVTTTVSGTVLPTKQYAGYYQHQTSGLEFAVYRAYDSNTGRWLSRDLVGESGGIDLYRYCGDEPIDFDDPLGLKKCWKLILITQFNDPNGDHPRPGHPEDKDNGLPLGPGDAASGVPGYVPGDIDKNGHVIRPIIHAKPVYPDGTQFTIYHQNGTVTNVTINDSGPGYAKSRPRNNAPNGVSPDQWLDEWNKSGNGNPEWDWVSREVPDKCPCPQGWKG
jgi:RHS repeat-associated protein